jgi:hypothetical protein
MTRWIGRLLPVAWLLFVAYVVVDMYRMSH